MNRGTARKLQIVALILFVGGSAIAVADELEISRYTIDGGGGFSSGGAFELSGTIGQPEAGFMTGGAYELDGGFWPASIPSCACLGDMNLDGARDGADIQRFIECMLVGGSCQCADIDEMNDVNFDDLNAFVTDLLAGTPCP